MIAIVLLVSGCMVSLSAALVLFCALVLAARFDVAYSRAKRRVQYAKPPRDETRDGS